MEQIRIFRSATAEDIERQVNHWLRQNPDEQVVDMSMVYEPPRPVRTSSEVPDEEAWLIIVRFETNATGGKAPRERPRATIKGAMAR